MPLLVMLQHQDVALSAARTLQASGAADRATDPGGKKERRGAIGTQGNQGARRLFTQVVSFAAWAVRLLGRKETASAYRGTWYLAAPRGVTVSCRIHYTAGLPPKDSGDHRSGEDH